MGLSTPPVETHSIAINLAAWLIAVSSMLIGALIAFLRYESKRHHEQMQDLVWRIRENQRMITERLERSADASEPVEASVEPEVPVSGRRITY